MSVHPSSDAEGPYSPCQKEALGFWTLLPSLSPVTGTGWVLAQWDEPCVNIYMLARARARARAALGKGGQHMQLRGDSTQSRAEPAVRLQPCHLPFPSHLIWPSRAEWDWLSEWGETTTARARHCYSCATHTHTQWHRAFTLTYNGDPPPTQA